MTQLSSMVRRRLFGISPSEVNFKRRGFPTRHPAAVERLERVGRSFVDGYLLALADPEPGILADAIDRRLEPAFRGFGFEGAGMALALLDYTTPWRRDRLRSFIAGPGDPHSYMVHIGAGWALARMRARVEPLLASLDPVLGWLVLDGYGFHEGYFRPDRSVRRMERPRRLSGYALRAFDTGLGRSLWFVNGADPDALAHGIARFEPSRHPELWAGSGLACSYAGGVAELEIERMIERAGPHRAWLAQGAAFAAKARERAGIPAPHTERAVERICCTTSELAAKMCDGELEELSPEDRSRSAGRGGTPGFELWRLGIHDTLASVLEAAGSTGRNP